MDGAADLLVEQDVAGEAGDIEVGAEGELAEVAGAFVGIEVFEQIVLALGGTGIDDFAVFEAEADIDDFAAADRRPGR